MHEIEQFIGFDFNSYNLNYFEKYFKSYVNLHQHLNILELIAYISFNEKLKTEIEDKLVKKLIYPLLLIIFAFITLSIFKYSVLPLFSSFTNQDSHSIVSFLYYFSIFLFLILILISIFTLYTFKHPALFIVLYYQFYKLRIFKIIETYYICLLSHLLIVFDKQGLSTYQTFTLINKFKGNTIIANLAYFVKVDLSKGKGLAKSIENMHINDNFKNIILMGGATNNYNKLLSQYSLKASNDIFTEIEFISKIVLTFAYIYIGLIVIVLYKILSLPISLISDI